VDLKSVRQDYSGPSIGNLPSEPHKGIEAWLAEALKTEVEATAFSLATHQGDDISVRVVLAKEIKRDGITFFSNRSSQKGAHLGKTPHAAGVFFWPNLQRQIRFEGVVSYVDTTEADAYFASRPRASQLAALASEQSARIDSYEAVVAKFAELEKKLVEKPVPRPDSWGGFLISLDRVEFWQGQRSRLHERLVFEKRDNGAYESYWLQP